MDQEETTTQSEYRPRNRRYDERSSRRAEEDSRRNHDHKSRHSRHRHHRRNNDADRDEGRSRHQSHSHYRHRREREEHVKHPVDERELSPASKRTVQQPDDFSAKEMVRAPKQSTFGSRFTPATNEDVFNFGTYGSSASATKLGPKTALPEKLETEEPQLQPSSLAREDRESSTASVVSYTIGDNGSEWRMMKLRRTIEAAKSSGVPVEQVALERYGSLRLFYEAREEYEELEKRKRPKRRGINEGDTPITKVTGRLYFERMAREGHQLSQETGERVGSTNVASTSSSSVPTLDQLNKMRAAVLRARLTNDPREKQLEQDFEAAQSAFEKSKSAKTAVINPSNSCYNQTIEEMVKEEKQTRRLGLDASLARNIMSDSRYSNDLDYMEEHANRLADRVKRREINLERLPTMNMKKAEHILDNCPLCLNAEMQPLAPVVALGHRAYLSLPTEPALAKYHCIIVPNHHRVNTLECDEDEWDEIRNFMKCVALMFDSLNMGVIFYENVPSPEKFVHTAIECVPVPKRMLQLAPAYFKEAILASDEEWSQHKKIIDTQAAAERGAGKYAFRNSMVKELGYFHVWFTIDGGLGHVVEDAEKWGSHDSLPRQVFATMLKLPQDYIRRRGKWTGGFDERELPFKKLFSKFDWTRQLTE
ncbi:complexed with Cdc5 protein Cwf19 [Schizosaccharomyces japonicus yFS275]|uniref:Complexed with Cdc5 protein Cwf19 n=1 Tax=Schizosaccharomyces japonicus (strain yFS275 / FY16936) TaxID=402676 RepID=B6JZN6_SCHJY|nr:complexed with Cdc5 protein Cwf19 [Schizosaccharomyces japonicus yFS275]EEB07004.2 complexed with Cdc5 protein Cwf19 [Schizosaccharomyces japonicus yFS275]